MEIRINKVEKDVALITQSLHSIAETLEKMGDVQIDTKILEEKFLHLDKELQESFSRVHTRLDKQEAVTNWVARLVIGGIIVALMTFMTTGAFK